MAGASVVGAAHRTRGRGLGRAHGKGDVLVSADPISGPGLSPPTGSFGPSSGSYSRPSTGQPIIDTLTRSRSLTVPDATRLPDMMRRAFTVWIYRAQC